LTTQFRESAPLLGRTGTRGLWLAPVLDLIFRLDRHSHPNPADVEAERSKVLRAGASPASPPPYYRPQGIRGLPLRLVPRTWCRGPIPKWSRRRLDILRADSSCDSPLRIADLGIRLGAILAVAGYRNCRTPSVLHRHPLTALRTARDNARQLGFARARHFVVATMPRRCRAIRPHRVESPLYRSVDIADLATRFAITIPRRAPGWCITASRLPPIAPEATLLAAGRRLVADGGARPKRDVRD